MKRNELFEKENYTETSVFNYNNKFIARFVASWNI